MGSKQPPASSRPWSKVSGAVIAFALAGCLLASGAAAQEQPGGGSNGIPFQGRFFWGGGIGFSFGDVESIQVSPMVGYRITRRIAAGLQLTYIYTSFSSYGRDYTTNDWGGNIFANCIVWRNLFVGAEYEYLRYEYYRTPYARTNSGYSSVFVGGGYFQPIGGHASVIVSTLYNLSYSDTEPGPYGSPWVIRAGIGVGF